jgi:hypothetical protein
MYMRIFMPLESEAKGEAAGSGSAIVENAGQCRVTVRAGGLKPGRHDVVLIFSGERGNTGVKAGSAVACDAGRLHLRQAVKPDALGLHNPHDVQAVVVLPEGSNSGLAGYRHKPFSWRSGFSMYEKAAPAPVVVAAPEPEPEVVPAPEPEVVVSPEPEPVAVVSPEPEPEVVVSPEPVPEASPVSEAVPAAFPAPATDKPTFVCADALVALFDGRHPVTPFDDFPRQTAWVEVAITDDIPLPPARPQLLEEAVVRAAYATHNHLLAGLTADDEPRTYYLGIPGEYDFGMRAQLRRMGFTEFHVKSGQPPLGGDAGYWLMTVAV